MAFSNLFRKEKSNTKNQKKKEKMIQIIAEISDQKELLKIVLTGSASDLRVMAVHKITDQFKLKEISETSKDIKVRIAAVREINDEPILAEIALSNTLPRVATSAASRIKDKALLFKIAREAHHTLIRKQIVGLIDDMDQLKEIGENDQNSKIKRIALNKYSSRLPKYTRVKIEIKCPFCSQPVFVNGPILTFKCHFCASVIDLKLSFWKGIIKNLFSAGYSVVGGYTFGFKGLELHSGVKFPECTQCGKQLPLEDKLKDEKEKIECAHCNRINTTSEPPEWMKKTMVKGRKVEWIYCSEADDYDKENSINSAKPIVTSCIQCGSNLKIMAQTPRNATCTYCGTIQYIPDDLWFAFHPIKIKKEWYIRWSTGQKK